MRHFALLLGATVVAVACADQNPSAPVRSANAVASGDVVASQPVKSAAAGKPTDQVGFTKITKVTAPGAVSPGKLGFVTVPCPAGTTVIGGGYYTSSGVGIGTTPVYVGSYADANNSWVVSALNQNPNGTLSFMAYAYCIS